MLFSPKQRPCSALSAPPKSRASFAVIKRVFARSSSRLVLAGVLVALAACAAKQTRTPATVSQQGQLPASGTVILRSGLEWTDERSPLFQDLRSALIPLLAAKGLKEVQGPLSRPAPLPRHFSPDDKRQASLPENDAKQSGNRAKPASAAKQGPVPGASAEPPFLSATEEQNRARIEELSAQGKLRPLRLARYDVPEQDAGLPASVMAVTPIDARAVLFAASQKRDFPLLPQAGPIPGRLPSEVSATDPALADYALVIRFAALQSPATGTTRMAHAETGGAASGDASLDGFVTAAGPVRGVGALGATPPAPSSPPRPAYGGTPGDYARGYEGMSPTPGDPWHRESDFLDRNYTTRHGSPPAYASPPQPPVGGGGGRVIEPYDPILPKPPLPGDSDPPARVRPVAPGSTPSKTNQGGGGQSSWDADDSSAIIEAGVAVQGYLLEMDCYALLPAGQGQAPLRVWNCRAQRGIDPAGLKAALPLMAAACVNGR